MWPTRRCFGTLTRQKRLREQGKVVHTAGSRAIICVHFARGDALEDRGVALIVPLPGVFRPG